MESCDIVVATTGVPGLINKKWVREGQVILALSNPKPEIEPEDALEAGQTCTLETDGLSTMCWGSQVFSGAC